MGLRSFHPIFSFSGKLLCEFFVTIDIHVFTQVQNQVGWEDDYLGSSLGYQFIPWLFYAHRRG